MKTTGRYAAAFLFVAAVFLAAAAAGADKIVLRIRAVNASSSRQVVKVSKQLPARIDPASDILDNGGLAVRYDPRLTAYFVETEVDLKPGETRDFHVVVRDIWAVRREELDELKAHAATLCSLLARTRHADTAARIRSNTETALAELEERRKQYDLAAVRAAEHIRASERNRELLDRAKTDIATLETMVIREGLDPGKLRGSLPALPGRTAGGNAVSRKTLVKRIRVSNPAAAPRKIPVKVYLPQEVLPEDVDPGKYLEVRYDAGRKMSYVTRDDVMVEGGKAMDFQVSVTDKWTPDPARIASLQSRATNLLAATGSAPAGLASEADRIARELAAAQTGSPPGELDENYIAFCRQQTAKLDDTERAIIRLEDYVKSRTRKPPLVPESPVEAPNRRSTWIIIYAILGFLVIVSSAFFIFASRKSPADRIFAKRKS